MTDRLDALAQSHGIQTRYRSEQGDPVAISDEAKRALLQILHVDPEEGEPGEFETAQHQAHHSCFLPPVLDGNKTWGLACQLYALRSRRSLGIGDFEDLAELAELGARAGASFVGVSPLHALFLADAGRCSPYSPSTRRFLNPLFIAVDALEGGREAVETLRLEDPAGFDALGGDLVDYPAVARVKTQLLRQLFAEAEPGTAFDAFCRSEGEALKRFALFEAISAAQMESGGAAGWHGWEDDLKRRDSQAVANFSREREGEVRFHQWLQFVADRQLGAAQERALAAGMAIGLYVDFAVGVSPDGAETWADPDLVEPRARVGAPPDMFNSQGQDWGLAPLSPEALAQRAYRPLAEAYRAQMRHAGAMRIDHAMGLARLWWIPEGSASKDGGYVRYPLGAMIDTAAQVSASEECLVIGEDLGTVPEGFREAAEDARILSYRVLYFERRGEAGFVAPADYPELSLACIATHDLPTLSGWWAGTDIDLREETGRQDEAATARDRKERVRDRAGLLKALEREGIDTGGADAKDSALSPALAAAVHRFAARTRSKLFAVQVDDMIGARRQPNLPGTTDEYPNWRIRCELPLEEIEADQRFATIARALREERPEADPK